MDVIGASVLFLRQRVQTNMKGCWVQSRLSLGQAVESSLLPQVVQQHLVFAHVAKVGITVNLGLVSELDLVQSTHPRQLDEAIVSWFYPYQDITLETQWPATQNGLALAQLVAVSKSKGVRSTFVLEHALSVGITRNLTAVNSYVPVHGPSAYKPDKYFIVGLEQL